MSLPPLQATSFQPTTGDNNSSDAPWAPCTFNDRSVCFCNIPCEIRVKIYNELSLPDLARLNKTARCFTHCIREDSAIAQACIKRYPELFRAIKNDPQFYTNIISETPAAANIESSSDNAQARFPSDLHTEKILVDYLKIMTTSPAFQLKKTSEAVHSRGSVGGHGKTIIKIQSLDNSRFVSKNLVDIKILFRGTDGSLQEEQIFDEKNTAFYAYNDGSVIISPDKQHLLTLDVCCKLRVYKQQDDRSWIVQGTSERFKHNWDDASDYDFEDYESGSADSEDEGWSNPIHPCPVACFIGNRHVLMHNTHNLVVWSDIPWIKEPLITRHISACVIHSDQQLAVSIDRAQLTLTFWQITENGELDHFVYTNRKKIQDKSLLIAPDARHLAFRDDDNAITLLGSDENNRWSQEKYFISTQDNDQYRAFHNIQFSDDSHHLLINSHYALHILSLESDGVWAEKELWCSQQITSAPEAVGPPRCLKISSTCISSKADRIAIGMYACPSNTDYAQYLNNSRFDRSITLWESSIILWERKSNSEWQTTTTIKSEHPVTKISFSPSSRHLIYTCRINRERRGFFDILCTPHKTVILTRSENDSWQETGCFISKSNLSPLFSPDEIYIIFQDKDRHKQDGILLFAGLNPDGRWCKKLSQTAIVVSLIIDKGQHIVTGDSNGKIKLYALLPQRAETQSTDTTDKA